MTTKGIITTNYLTHTLIQLLRMQETDKTHEGYNLVSVQLFSKKVASHWGGGYRRFLGFVLNCSGFTFSDMANKTKVLEWAEPISFLVKPINLP